MENRDDEPLKRMVGSAEPATRLKALRLMREDIAAGSLSGDHLALAKTLINDADNNCRWQALIVVGEFVQTQPESVWQVILEFGESPDEDMRDGVATTLLEHLLEHHFDAYLPRLGEAVKRSSLMADTLARCWAFGQAHARWAEIRQLLARP